ncbi:hypothetical protein JD844_027393 [Phrynosoma platyrhinos]|uniref:Uncharacterized protein n=1 Tax=Phrynosoma platyrhinos TaxID=52577 RepID=A0ABQ7SG99_PHRPL|nr:hypothetical protein JD844_027393 [Phrynosoma platyrhinos]
MVDDAEPCIREPQGLGGSELVPGSPGARELQAPLFEGPLQQQGNPDFKSEDSEDGEEAAPPRKFKVQRTVIKVPLDQGKGQASARPGRRVEDRRWQLPCSQRTGKDKNLECMNPGSRVNETGMEVGGEAALIPTPGAGVVQTPRMSGISGLARESYISIEDMIPPGEMGGLENDTALKDASPGGLLELSTVDRGVISFFGMRSSLFLAMNNKGRLYGSVSMDDFHL